MMWRSSFTLLVSSAVRYKPNNPPLGLRAFCSFSSKVPSGDGGGGDNITFAEAKKLLKLVNVEELKLKLGREGKEVIRYSELLQTCESMGVAKSHGEAEAFARVLDEAGVVLLFRDRVYLHPHKVVELVRKAVPLILTPEDDPRRDELKRLQDKKEKKSTGWRISKSGASSGQG